MAGAVGPGKGSWGERLQLLAQQEDRTHWRPEPIPLVVVHEDPSLIVINKPAGLVVHPGAGNWDGTLCNALLYHYPELSQVPRAGLVHRLDKDTSGLLVVARSESAQGRAGGATRGSEHGASLPCSR